MTELTPLEKLDDAVREFLASIDTDGQLSGWVLGYQMSKLQDDPACVPLMFNSDYTFGASTSPETAVGVARLTAARLERQLLADDGD